MPSSKPPTCCGALQPSGDGLETRGTTPGYAEEVNAQFGLKNEPTELPLESINDDDPEDLTMHMNPSNSPTHARTFSTANTPSRSADALTENRTPTCRRLHKSLLGRFLRPQIFWLLATFMLLSAERAFAVTLTLYVHSESTSGPLLSGVRVTGTDGAGRSFDQTTGAGGYVTITGTAGTWSFTASKSGYETARWNQSITATVTRHAFLKPTVVHPPDVPIPQSPGTTSEPGPTISTLQPTLTWTAAARAERYSLAISRHPYGTENIVHCAANLTGTAYTVPAGVLNPGVRYRWNMRAHNSAGNSPFSQSLYFQTSPVAPTVTITTPAGNQTVPHATTTFTFSGSATAPGSAVASVQWRVNGGSWNPATGTTAWSFTVNLVVGANVVEVRAQNTQGTFSPVASRTITREAAPPTAAIDGELLDSIDKFAGTYYKANWNLRLEQYKAWIATIAWGEGGRGGYGAHSGYQPGTPLDNDAFYHKDYKDSTGKWFIFSTGIGPFQIDRIHKPTLGIDARKMPTIDKLDYKKALEIVLKYHYNRFGPRATLGDFAQISEWYAVNPNYNGNPSAHWAAVTGTGWTIHKDGPQILD